MALHQSLKFIITTPVRPSPTCLEGLAVGDAAVVKHLGNARPVALRLMEMGLLPGTKLTLERVAPLGDPLVVRIRGYALSLRKEEARLVEIERSAAT
jgi:ferrous iron transport protein A